MNQKITSRTTEKYEFKIIEPTICSPVVLYHSWLKSESCPSKYYSNHPPGKIPCPSKFAEESKNRMAVLKYWQIKTTNVMI
jgi:hypothetical protein